MGSPQDKREQHRLMRDAMDKRFIRVTRGSIIGGTRLGIFTASFFSLQNFLAEKRVVHDVFNVVGAGSATAAIYGLITTDTSRASSFDCYSVLLESWLIKFSGKCKMLPFQVLTCHYL